MKSLTVLFLVIFVIALLFIVPYLLTDRFRKSKLSKFIPALLCLIVIAIFYIKLNFFSPGFSGIVDMVFIIIFAIAAVVLLILALFLTTKYN